MCLKSWSELKKKKNTFKVGQTGTYLETQVKN